MTLATLTVVVGGIACASPARAAPPPHAASGSQTKANPGPPPGRGPSHAVPAKPGLGRGPNGEHPHGDGWPPGGGVAEAEAVIGAAEDAVVGVEEDPGAGLDGEVDVRAASVTRGPTVSAGGGPVLQALTADEFAGVGGLPEVVADAPVPVAVGPPAIPGDPVGVENPLMPIHRDPGGVGWWLVVAVAVAAVSGFGLRHVTSRHEIASARRFATRDPLTGLANRRLFDETLAREIARQQRSATPLALALVDLDHFKHVNDTRGHAGGDEVLRTVAQAIRTRVRASDLPARIGGDEFAVVLPDCSPRDAQRVGEALRGAIESVVDAAVTASVGIAVVPDHAHDGDTLVAAADAALYAAKEGGRNRAVLMAPDAATTAEVE